MRSKKIKALFLDRDGVINIDYGYVGSIEDFEFIDGILDFILDAQRAGYFPIVVTNQSGIARGYYTQDDFERVTAFMLKRMQEHNIDITREQIFFCPHRPDENCNCRKPKAGMFFQAFERFNIDKDNSLMIGDKESDIQAAKAAGLGYWRRINKNEKIKWEDIDEFQ